VFSDVSESLPIVLVINRNGSVSHLVTTKDIRSNTIKISVKMERILVNKLICNCSSEATDRKNGIPKIPIGAPLSGDIKVE
jgi:hypothetical protein